MRTILSVAAFCLVLVSAAFADSSASGQASQLAAIVSKMPRVDPFERVRENQEAEKGEASIAAKCCKVCLKGKACGNTCIARNKVCHVPPGCACDG
jgi:hypothetical protein